MSLNVLYSVSSAINAVTSFVLGFFILLKNPRDKLHQVWWWMSLAIAIWAGFLSLAFATGPYNYSLSLFLVRFGDTAAIFIPLLYLHFIVVFLGCSDQRYVLRICYILSVLLACFGFTSLYIPNLKTKLGIVNYNDAGPLFGLFFALYLWEPIYAIHLMRRARQITSGLRRKHITYVMTAGIVGFLVGATFFPSCFNIMIPPIGGHVVWLYCLFITWAAFKYHLFNVNVVVRRSLVYSLLVTLLTVGYFGLVYTVERVFQTTFRYQSIWLSLGAFALMALAFQPLKIGIQRLVDWLFFRAPHEELVKRMERLEQEAQQTEKLKAVATLAAGMAHEIKNPLSSIKTFTEYLPQKYDDPDFREKFARIVSQEVGKINDLVQRLLEFAKPPQPQKQPVRISQLIDETVELLHDRLLSKHIEVARAYTQDDGLCVDPGQMKQVFLNVLLNSIDAMDHQGCISIATVAENGHVEIVMADTGPGIPKKDLAHVFDPFYTTKSAGTGLGLSVVHSIVQEHGGRVVLDSDTGRGTTVRIQLPVHA